MMGHPLLRQQLAKHFSPLFNNRPLDPNSQILVTNGALGAIFSVLMNFAKEGDEVLMFEPFFTLYVNNIEFSGATIVTAPMHTTPTGEWQFDFQAFEDAISPKTKVVLLTNPHNPTGKMFTLAEIKQMSDILDKHPHITVLSDEVYFHLTFDGHKHLSFANYSESNWAKTVTVFSAGKMLNCTGWKIGWAIGPAPLIKQAMFTHESIAFNTNVPGQIAVAESLDQAFGHEYEGCSNYLEYTKQVF